MAETVKKAKTPAKAATKTVAPAKPKPAAKKAAAAPKKKSAPTREQIAALAKSYWEARGGQNGSSEEDWLRAEQELLQK
jgi:hypothetical protein